MTAQLYELPQHYFSFGSISILGETAVICATRDAA
jgi:hypothetical protein